MNTTRLNSLMAQARTARESAEQTQYNIDRSLRVPTAAQQQHLDGLHLLARVTERRLYAYKSGLLSKAPNPFSHPELADLYRAAQIHAEN